MHQLYKFSFFLFLLATSCANDAKQAQNTQENQQCAENSANFTALATEYCSCSSDLIALNKKAKELAAHPELIKSPEEMSDLLMQSEALQQQQIDCQQRLEQQFNVSIKDNPQVLNAIKQNCPELAELMESSKKTEE